MMKVSKNMKIVILSLFFVSGVSFSFAGGGTGVHRFEGGGTGIHRVDRGVFLRLVSRLNFENEVKIPQTGQAVTMKNGKIVRVRDGKIVVPRATR